MLISKLTIRSTRFVTATRFLSGELDVSHIKMKTNKGDIFEVQVNDGHMAYAQALNEPEFAFFSSNPEKSNEGLLFRIWVHKSAIKNWKKVGNIKISGVLDADIPRFKKDPISSAYSTYIGGVESCATYEQVKGLECAAVWEWPHIEERLVAYFSGTESKWVKSMQPVKNG